MSKSWPIIRIRAEDRVGQGVGEGDIKVTRRHIAPLTSRPPFHGNMSLGGEHQFVYSLSTLKFFLQEKLDSSQVSQISGGQCNEWHGCVISEAGRIIDSTLCCLSPPPPPAADTSDLMLLLLYLLLKNVLQCNAGSINLLCGIIWKAL